METRTGALLPHLNSGRITATKIVVPPISDQKEIVKYLDEKSRYIRRLVEIKQSKIEKLNSYKKSLVYEYVTGKKEVV